MQSSLEDLLSNVLRSIEKESKIKKINIADLKEFLLKYANKSIEKKYLLLIMNHLGDGN